MKKINKKYLASAIAVSGIMASSVVMPSFATTVTNGDATVPVYLTATATPIDVTIGTGLDDTTGLAHEADAIYVTAQDDVNAATVTNLVVKNNSDAAPIYVKNIVLGSTANGYTNVAYSDDFSLKAVDSKQFALAITSISSQSGSGIGGNEITATDLKTGYTPATGDTVEHNGSVSYGLSGKASASSANVDAVKVADCIITVSQTNN